MDPGASYTYEPTHFLYGKITRVFHMNGKQGKKVSKRARQISTDF